jgi:hypothetical protein
MISSLPIQIISHRLDQPNFARALPVKAVRFPDETEADDTRLEIEQAASLALEPLPHGLINADLGLSFCPLILALISTLSYRMKENRVLEANEKIGESGTRFHDYDKT